ncbi:MAG: hypothetical protein WD847_05505 [Pirellulales bacterium]
MPNQALHLRGTSETTAAESEGLELHLVAAVDNTAEVDPKSKYIVQGWPARVIGIIGLLPLPVSFVVAAAVATVFLAQGKEVTNDSFFWVATAIEGSIVLSCLVAMAILVRVYRTPLPADA